MRIYEICEQLNKCAEGKCEGCISDNCTDGLIKMLGTECKKHGDYLNVLEKVEEKRDQLKGEDDGQRL